MDKVRQKQLGESVRSVEITSKYGDPVKIHKYCNTGGKWLFAVCRFENKTVSFYHESGNWVEGIPKDRFLTLYHAEQLQQAKNIIIVDSEEAADIVIPGYTIISWLHNAKNISSVYWNPISTKQVIIWPSNSQYGDDSAKQISGILKKSKIIDVSATPENWNILQCDNPIEFLNNCTYLEKSDNKETEEINIYDDNGKHNPFLIYRSYINTVYPGSSLDQISGVYWNYSKKKHYWEIQIKKDIEVNFHRWIEKNAVFADVSERVCPVTIIKKSMHYLSNHSITMVDVNPFKESAISPYIHTQNGVIKLSRSGVEHYGRELHPESFFKNLYPISCLPFSYNQDLFNNINPENDCPAFIHYIRTLIPDNSQKQFNETVSFFAQILAYCISPIKPNEYFFGLYGKQETGKSFFIKILKSIIGHEFCIERRISDMDSRFATADLWGKKVYIEPDLKTRQLLPEDFIKSFAGEQSITVERKHEQSIHGVHTSIAMFFVSNYIFQVKGLEGLIRRMIIIPYRKKLDYVDRDLLGKIIGTVQHGKESGELSDTQFDERPAILALALRGWNNFCKNNYEIKMPQWIAETKQSWFDEASTVRQFLRDVVFSGERDDEYNSSVAKMYVYSQYKIWCSDEGRRPLGKRNFIEDVLQDNRVEEGRIGNTRSFRFIRDDDNF